MMRIAVVSAAHPYRGGIAQFTDAMVTELREGGHDVGVFTFSRQYPSLLFPGKSQLKDEAETVPDGTFRTIDTINPLSWFATGRSIVAFKPDIVLVNFWMPFTGLALGAISRYVRSRCSSTIICICHNIVPHERRPGDALLTRSALRQADRFIVLSSSVGEDLLRIIPGADYRVVHHPVYDVYGPARSRSSVQRALGVEDKKVLLFFGLVRNYKGLDLLLRALPEICASVPAHLFIVGEFYEPENTYRDIIRSLGLGDDVTIVNRFVPDDEVGTYFSAADVVVLPYRAATQSGVVQIAMHFDRACIVTDTGGLAEMVADGETGFVIPVDDTTSLAESVIRFFKGSHQSSFEAAVRENKGRYSWNSLARAIEEIASTAPAR